MQQIQATEQAFAAILEDGSVVTWGDSSAVQHELRFGWSVDAFAE